MVCPAVGFADLRKRIQQQTQAQQFFQKQLQVRAVFEHAPLPVPWLRSAATHAASDAQDIQREVTGMRQRHEEATKVTIAGACRHFALDGATRHKRVGVLQSYGDGIWSCRTACSRWLPSPCAQRLCRAPSPCRARTCLPSCR